VKKLMMVLMLSSFLLLFAQTKQQNVDYFFQFLATNKTSVYAASQKTIFMIENQHLLPVKHLNQHINGLAVTDEKLFVTHGVQNGKLTVFNINNDERTDISAGHAPCAPVVLDKQTVVVCNRFSGHLSWISLENQSITQTYAGREPIAAASSGKTLVVAHHLPEQPSIADTVAAKVSFWRIEDRRLEKSILLPNGSSGIRELTITPDQRWCLIPHLIARYNLPTTQLERAWMNTNALSIIDLKKQELYKTVLLDDIDQGHANPWAVCCSPNGDKIYVTHAGTHELSIIDFPALLQRIKYIEHPENRLDVVYPVRKIVQFNGNGPRAVICKNDTLVIAHYFSNSLEFVDTAGKMLASKDFLVQQTVAQKGEMYFNDASNSFQQWQSCNSCHPDVRADGFNWDLLNDGIGNPKNAYSLVRSHLTPPVMWTGIREDAYHAVRAGMIHIEFAFMDDLQIEALDEFLIHVDPVPSPHLVDGELTASAKRGEQFFKDPQVGCHYCHYPTNYFTDGFQHNVGTWAPRDVFTDKNGRIQKQLEFDTPTLHEVWRTAPYLHDGRYTTIEEVLTIGNAGDRHGRTSHLSKDEIQDLVSFILSL